MSETRPKTTAAFVQDPGQRILARPCQNFAIFHFTVSTDTEVMHLGYLFSLISAVALAGTPEFRVNCEFHLKNHGQANPMKVGAQVRLSVAASDPVDVFYLGHKSLDEGGVHYFYDPKSRTVLKSWEAQTSFLVEPAAMHIQKQYGPNCATFSTVHCLEFLDWDIPELKKERLMRSMIETLADPKISPKAQDQHVIHVLTGLGLTVKKTESLNTLEAHLKKGRPALLTVGVKREWVGDGIVSLTDGGTIPNGRRKHYVPTKPDPFNVGNLHAVVAIGTFETSDGQTFFVIVDSDSGEITVWSRAELERGLYGEQLLVRSVD